MRLKLTLVFLFCGLAGMVLSVGLNQPCNPVDINLFCDDQLMECIPDEYEDLTCQCIEDHFELTRTTCAPFPTHPGDSCHTTDAPCTPSIPNSQCTSATCQCNPDYQHDTLNQRCLLKPTNPGDICEPNSVPCISVGGTNCQSRPELEEYICECSSPDQVTDIPNGNCLTKPSKPGDPCTAYLTPCASVTNTTCISVGGSLTCQCVLDLVTNPVEGKCLVQPKRPGETCDATYTPCNLVSSTHCAPHPDLSTPICTCSDPLEATDYDNHRCLRLPQFPGDSCHPKFTKCDLDTSHLPTTCSSEDGVSYYCKCDKGTVNDFERRRCLNLPLQPGDECFPISAACDLIPDTLCKEDGLQYSCLCEGNLITDKPNGRCLRIPEKLNDPCEPLLAPCDSAPLTECDPNLLECKCIPPYIPYEGNMTCLSLPKLPGDLCDITTLLTCQDVLDATTCKIYPPTNEFVCTCDINCLDRPNRRCIPSPQFPLDLCNPITAPCTNVPLTECRVHVGTSDFKCFCNEGLVHDPLARRCVAPPTRPGDPCEPTTAPCANVNNTQCTWEDTTGHVCKCRGYLVTEYGYCFPPPTKPGDQCSVNLAPCPSLTTSTCVESDQLNFFFCKCNGADVITDPEFGRCIPTPINTFDPCDPVKMPCPLQSNMECSLVDQLGHICTCAEGFVHDAAGKRCIALPQIPGDPCESSVAPCSSVTNTSCTPNPDDPTKHSCWCVDSQITDLGRCFVPPTRPSQPCSISQQEGACPPSISTTCALHSSPWNNFRCLCSTPGYFTDFPFERCAKFPTLPGDPCSPSEASPCPENSTCSPLPLQGNYCKCLDGFFQSADTKCVSLPTKPEEYCESNDHCSAVTGTLCTASACRCIPEDWDLSTIGPYCVKKVDFVNGPCETSLQCSNLPSTSCVESVCECDKPSFPSETKDACLYPVDILNLRCIETPQCLRGIGEGSVCVEVGEVRLCSCDYGYIPSVSGKQCLKAWNPDENCVETGQCQALLGDRSECDREGRCVCTSDAVLFNATCVLKRSVGQSCSSFVECVLGTNGFGVCNSGTCRCWEDLSYEDGGMCQERLRVGSPCLLDRQCVKSLNTPYVSCHPSLKVCTCTKFSGIPGTCASAADFLHFPLIGLVVSILIATLLFPLN